MVAIGEAQRLAKSQQRKSERGLLRANPAHRRVAKLPNVMASPPTVTWNGAGVTHTLAGGVLHSYHETNVFRVFGGTIAQAGTTGNLPNFAKSNYVTTPTGTPPYWLDFEVYVTATDKAFEIFAMNNGGQFRLLIDGEYTQLAAYNLFTAISGAQESVKVTFAAAGHHRVTLEAMDNFLFGGVWIEANGAIWQSSYDLGPMRLMIVGDSFGEGSGGSGALTGFAATFGYLMKWSDTWSSSVGSTGYNNPGTSGKVNFQTRLATDVIANAPDAVLFCGGINDETQTPAVTYASEYAAASYCFAQVRAQLPEAKLIVCGPWWSNGSPSANLMLVRDSIRQAAIDNDADLYIENIGGVFPYSGTLANYVNTGWMTANNKPSFTSSIDNTHPTDAGHEYLARRLATAVNAWINAGAPRLATWQVDHLVLAS